MRPPASAATESATRKRDSTRAPSRLSRPSSVCAVSCTSTRVTSSAAPVRKLTPSVARNGPRDTPVMSISLVLERHSHATNAAPDTTPATIMGMPHGGRTDPLGSGLWRPATSRPSASASSSPPTTSTRPAVPRTRSRAGGGTDRCTATAARATSGTFSQKIDRQPPSCTPPIWRVAGIRVARAAPYRGPSTLPSSWADPTAPSATGRSSSSHRSPIRAMVMGSSAPPATPCTARPATSQGTVSPSAVTTEPTAKPARHRWMSGRLP